MYLLLQIEAGRRGPDHAGLLAARRLTDLANQIADAAGRLDGLNRAREAGLVACRAVIRASSSAIRAVHLGHADVVARRLDEAATALASAVSALQPFPAIREAGFLHDAEKEYVEARSTVAALVSGEPLPPGRPTWPSSPRPG